MAPLGAVIRRGALHVNKVFRREVGKLAKTVLRIGLLDESYILPRNALNNYGFRVELTRLHIE
jgi:hypothetical protein